MFGRSSSISNRLTRLTLLVSGASLLLAGISFYVFEEVYVRGNVLRNTSSQAQIVGANSASAIVFNDPNAASNTLAALRSSNNVISAGILTPDGKPFAIYRRNPGSDALHVPPIPPGQQEAHWYINGQLLLAQRIMLQDQFVGTVYIRNDLATLRTRRLSYLEIVLAVLLLSLLAALILSRSLQRSVVEPITNLADTAGIVSRERNYAVRAEPAAGFSELTILVRAFNQMLEEIQRHDQALQASQADLELRVDQRTRQLIAANRELEAFSYSVSHDLRGPLDVIEGFLFIFTSEYGDKLDANALEYLQQIRNASRRMNELIEDLLHLSHVTTSAMHREQVDLAEVARGIAQDLLRREPDRQVQFIIPEVAIAEGDSRLLKIALENLIRNAWKYTSGHRSATIEFGSEMKAGSFAYFVRDDGAGFNPASLDRLFKPFQRLHTSAEFPGTGVGLATVQRIIHRHGGQIWAEGDVEKGATFYFTLNWKESGTEIRRTA